MLLLDLMKHNSEVLWKNFSCLNEIYHYPTGIFLNRKFLEGAVTESGEMGIYDLKRHSKNSALIFFSHDI